MSNRDHELTAAAWRCRQTEQDMNIYRGAMATARTRERFEDALNACVKAAEERDAARLALLDAAHDGGYTEYIAACWSQEGPTGAAHLTYSEFRTICGVSVIKSGEHPSNATCTDCLIMHARNALGCNDR